MTIGLLGQKLGIHLPAASHAADRLVTLGLAERCEDPDDRRRTFVRLTPRGSALVEQLRQGKRDRFRAWPGRLDDDDLAALPRGPEAIASVARR